MRSGSSPAHRPADVDATGILQRKRLEAELFSLEGQVRTFARIRERLVAADRDPSAFYRELQKRREKLARALKQARSGPTPANLADPQLPVARFDEPLLARPISPARFDSKLGIFGFGSSGMVQVAPANENTNVVAQGPYPHTGEISTIPGSYPGAVTFSGNLNVGPEEISPDQYDPTLNYFWIRTWKFLIPFPPPSGLSRLTYRFDVYANVSLWFEGGEGSVMTFVSLGEAPNLTSGTNVTVNIDGGWPLNVNLAEPGSTPGSFYNGHYGFVVGQVTVQRSFMVGSGNVPGVAVVVGAVGALSMMSHVDLFFPSLGDSYLSIYSQSMTGRVAYSYEPQLVAQQ